MSRSKDDILEGTRQALRRWAAANRFNLPNLAKPSPQPMGGRSTSGGEVDLDDECKQVEAAVNEMFKSEPHHRRMILLHYLANGTIREKVRYLAVGCKEYYERLQQAEYAVKVRLGY